jgi:high affinity Mn2+ porin
MSLRIQVGLVLAAAAAAATARADPAPEDWSIHAQSTVIEQWHGGFTSPYEGENSLDGQAEDAHTVSATLFLGRALWSGAGIYLDPEMTQGGGLSGTLGLAGFSNGEATHTSGGNAPQFDIARLFVRQTIGLGGAREPVTDDQNQLCGSEDVNRLTLTLGKLSATDIFDNNSYSHDPRTQFLNIALGGNGAWDFPANTKGYTSGFAAEWNRSSSTLRWGVFLEPSLADGPDLDYHLAKAWGQVAEGEQRYTVDGHPGALRLLGFWNRADMGSYSEATAEAHPDITTTRAYRSKTGAGLNWEQELAGGLGAFARLGFDDGHTETWAFTEIDRTASAGLSLKGSPWGRSPDTLGLAAVVNGLSDEHRAYLAAGGYGFAIGDGRLTYGTEDILESYYDWKPVPWLALAFDYQFVEHPAYNRDRGPVSILATRAHWEY